MTPTGVIALQLVLAGISTLASCGVLLKVAFMAGELKQKVAGQEQRLVRVEDAVFPVTTH